MPVNQESNKQNSDRSSRQINTEKYVISSMPKLQDSGMLEVEGQYVDIYLSVDAAYKNRKSPCDETAKIDVMPMHTKNKSKSSYHMTLIDRGDRKYLVKQNGEMFAERGISAEQAQADIAYIRTVFCKQ